MAINLYVTSTQNFSGKSAVCLTLMDRMRKDGYRVGYLKPFSSAARVLAESSVDEDARFIKETFHLSEPLELLAPVVVTGQRMRKILTEDNGDYRSTVKQAAETIGQDKDIVVMEGSDNFREGYIVKLSLNEVANLVDAKVITVVGYQNSLQVIDDTLTALTRLGERLIGVIINAVPENRLGYVHQSVLPYVQAQGVDVLAVLPYEQTLHSIAISKIVEVLGGELLCGDCLEELVENLLVGAMNVENALNYFRAVKNKAVIVGGDRPDIQLAALETSTKVLILTGNIRPNPVVEAKAEERGVAIMLSPYDTLTTIEKVEQFFGRSGFHEAEKVTRFALLLNQSLNFDQLYQRLGLPKVQAANS
ncbi:MAG: phosphotransacetylase family protein [Anaerolineales bacterium]|nr:phosphotransacetylase family protein [Anaerolineales bacterium]